MMLLSELKLGEEAIIDAFELEELKVRFFEMGCVPGQKISIALKAPFGDPIAINIDGSRLSIRKKDANKIRVSKI